MKVCVYGLWHLGSVTAACLASVGHDVTGLDVDQLTIDGLTQGKAPLFEPGLDALIQTGIESDRLGFTTNISNAASDAEVLWVTFDTPVDEDDRADVEFVLNQIKDLLPGLEDGPVVLVSSQMPVGSIHKLEEFSRMELGNKQLSFAFSPENLRLGKALNLFLDPDRIVVGIRDENTQKKLGKLLLPITARIEWMSIESAEMTKHAINAFLATSVTFMNEIASICERVGADAKEVERGLKTEKRIGPGAYLAPGGPFSGGTLARDIEFLEVAGNENNLATPLIASVRLSNDEHKTWIRRKLVENFTDLKGITVAVWGLTYKPGTDTLRRSLAIELCDWLIEKEAIVQVYDPVVKQLPGRWTGRIHNEENALNAVSGADVLVIGTEWPEFRQQSADLMSVASPSLVLIDANRHILPRVALFGLKYITVGAPIP